MEAAGWAHPRPHWSHSDFTITRVRVRPAGQGGTLHCEEQLGCELSASLHVEISKIQDSLFRTTDNIAIDVSLCVSCQLYGCQKRV